MKLVLLPGLGATAEMYGPEFDAVAEEVARGGWPAARGEATVPAMAERIIDEHGLERVDVLAGSSLGGMVGAEIAARIPVGRLVLIGSARHPSEVNPLLRQIAKLRDVLPLEQLQHLVGMEFFSGRARILEMVSRADPDQVRAMCGAIFAWEGRREVPSARVHGAWDLVIPPSDRGAELVPRAGHMVAMSHGEVVAEFLRGVVEEAGR